MKTIFWISDSLLFLFIPIRFSFLTSGQFSEIFWKEKQVNFLNIEELSCMNFWCVVFPRLLVDVAGATF